MGLIDQMMANIYKPPKQEKPATILPKNLTPAKVANMSNQPSVTQGQFLKGQVLDLRASQIMVLLENGATVSARTEGTLNLSIGETARFFVAQTTEDQILLKLAKEEGQGENPMIDKALTAANIQKTERSVSIVTELLNHQQPVNESNIRHYLSLSAKHPELPVKSLILMELHHIPVTKENVEQFALYQDRNAKLLTQAQDLLQNLSKAVEQIPEGPTKQEILNELSLLTGKEAAPALSGQTSPAESFLTPQTALPDTPVSPASPLSSAEAGAEPAISKDGNSIASPEAGVPTPTQQTTPLPSETVTAFQITKLQTERSDPRETLLSDFFESFLLKPEEIADSEKVQKYYDELNEKLARLEQLSQKVAEQTNENSAAASPKQMRQNLSFMEAVNNVFPYLQLPLKFKETPAHGELYVYERKKSLKPSDSLSALLHLELEALGTTDIFVTLAGTHVTTRFSLTSKESGDFITAELPSLTEALAAKGYTLQSEVSVREPEDETSITLLEQFLEEHAPGGLNRYTFDIRA